MRSAPVHELNADSLRGLFPAGVSCVFSDEPPEMISLPPDEAQAARKMRTNRQREFAHGRACARLALAEFGMPNCTVPVGSARAPVWPDGFIGSISHSGIFAAAVAARSNGTNGLGVDLEINEGLDMALLPMICRPEELEWLSTTDSGTPVAKLIFSAKECVFKCVWPEFQEFIDFQELEVRMNLRQKTYTVIPRATRLPGELIRRVHGRYEIAKNLIATAAFYD